MTGNSASSRPDFWSWVRAALAFHPIDNRILHDADLPLIYRVNAYQAMVRQGNSWQEKRSYLTILLLAAVTAVLAERTDSRVPAIIAAVLYGLTIIVGVRASRWRSGFSGHIHRVAAETAKSMAWLYMVHGGPFHSRVAAPDALFMERLDGTFGRLNRMGFESSNSVHTAFGGDQITPAMRAVRSKRFEARREIYLRDRLLEQSKWCRKVSAQARTASVRWSIVTTSLTLLALLAAVLQAAGLVGGWGLASLISAAVAAAVAWQEAQRHRPRAYAYALIEQELETLRLAMATTVTEEDWADAVADAEQLMSPQHTDMLMRVGT